MQKTLDKGYVFVVSGTQFGQSYHPRWYSPHHSVINLKKSNKVRVVLDCVTKVSGKYSSDLLYKDPDTTAD